MEIHKNRNEREEDFSNVQNQDFVDKNKMLSQFNEFDAIHDMNMF